MRNIGLKNKLPVLMRILVFSFFLLMSCQTFAQQKEEDITIILGEQTLNKVFAALGPVYGSDTYSLLLMKGTYR
jgi:hypothetical protein